MLSTIGNLIKVLFFFLDLWREKDEAKSEAKKKIASEVVDAFKQTDKKERASRLNAVVEKIREM